jgi:hypothetical protein
LFTFAQYRQLDFSCDYQLFYTELDIFHIPYEALKNTIYKHTLPDIIDSHICISDQQKYSGFHSQLHLEANLYKK